ncbi:MAG: DUF418 domain-containing protein [Pseudomonadota bacterium]|nr:DUF418 domain-containing protein [Pseudomonadota bacterium]
MAATSPPSDRLISLDVIRGIAVMGIFSVNVVGMAMIQIAYFYPPAFGFESLFDRLMWLINFLLIDGKMRSLFSMLFGASMLLVINRAVRSGRPWWRTHYPRMAVLLALGYLHFALLWWGDILTHYAAVGMVAALLWRLRAETLLMLSVLGFVLFAVPGITSSSQQSAEYHQSQAPDAPAELRARWAERVKDVKPDAATIAQDRAEHRSIATRFNAVISDPWSCPLDLGPLWIETMALMLLGMAGYKSGFLTGEWQDHSYRGIAAICLGIAFTAYATLAFIAWRADFAPLEFMFASRIASPPFRPVAAIGYAALFILLFRNPGKLRERFAAIGRTAFSNYIGCTIIGTMIFYGFAGDFYARLSRGEAWLLVPPVWLLMLAWSKPWLDRFNYGPLEWLWRSAARMELQPMRKRVPQPPATAAA